MPDRYVIEGSLLDGDWEAPPQPFGIVLGEERANLVVRELSRYFDGDFHSRKLPSLEQGIVQEQIRQVIFQQHGLLSFQVAEKVLQLNEQIPLEFSPRSQEDAPEDSANNKPIAKEEAPQEEEFAGIKWRAHPFYHTTEHLPKSDPRRSGTFQVPSGYDWSVRLPMVVPDLEELAILSRHYPGSDPKTPPWKKIRTALLTAGISVVTVKEVTSRDLIRMLDRVHAQKPVESKQPTKKAITQDTKKKTSQTLPDNPDVRDLCRLLEKQANRGKPLIDIARKFTNEIAGNSPKADSLLRQSRRYRHLWDRDST